jgi:hypothetical protein
MPSSEYRIRFYNQIPYYPILANKRCWTRKFKHSSSAISTENLRYCHALLLRSTPCTVINFCTSSTCGLSITCGKSWTVTFIGEPTRTWTTICRSLTAAFNTAQSGQTKPAARSGAFAAPLCFYPIGAFYVVRKLVAHYGRGIASAVEDDHR